MVNEFHFALGIEKGACYRGLISLPVAWVSPKTHHCSCGEQKVIYRLTRRIRGKVDWGVKETLVAAQRLPNTGLEGRLRHKMWHCLFQSTGSRGTELIVGAGPCVCPGDSENGGTCRFVKSQILFMLHPEVPSCVATRLLSGTKRSVSQDVQCQRTCACPHAILVRSRS